MKPNPHALGGNAADIYTPLFLWFRDHAPLRPSVMSYRCPRFPSKVYSVLATSYIQSLPSLSFLTQRTLRRSLPLCSFHVVRSHGFTMVANKQSYCTHAKPSNRLILCFDGTGNEFKGASGDTNIVKLYNMFDRTNLSQMHYYQRRPRSKRPMNAC